MLDLIVILVTLLIGGPLVAALLWKSYGPGGVFWRERVTSSSAPVPDAGTSARSRHSYAAEQGRNEPEQTGGIAVPGSLVGRVQAMDEGELLGMLALLTDETGEWRYSESRLAKFAGGRVADRMDEIRALRESVRPNPPPEPERTVRVRDTRGEREIAW